MAIVVGPPGVLVAIEGIDGAGKTTQVERLTELFTREGYSVVRTKEPTDGPWGRKLRESATTGRLSPEDELDTFLRDRREHVATLLRPSLGAGKIVLVDRYYYSSVAYQGARGLDPDEILRLNESFAPRPDLLVILEIDPAAGVSRVNRRGVGNLIEREDDLRRSADIFKKIAHPNLARIDATQAPEVVMDEIVKALRETIARRGQRV